MAKPTLQTVADAVGVSRSTVSNAYGRPDQLSPELRERIMAAARRLGYSGPDPTARSLRRGRAGAIGVLLAPAVSYAFSDPYAVEFMRGLTEAAEQHDTGVLLLSLKDDDDEALAAVQSAAVDGFCVYCVPGWYRALGAVTARGLPVVNSTQGSPGDAELFVGIDESAAAAEAGRHLTGLGHRRVAIIGNNLIEEPVDGIVRMSTLEDVPSYVTRERLRGYRDTFTAAGVPWDDIVTVNVVGNSRSGGAKAARLVVDGDPEVTALVALSDVLALGVLAAFAERGLTPGRDVSVLGFDDIPDAAAAGLSTVRQSPLERGRIAARLLLEPPSDPEGRHVVLPTQLVVRSSTGPVRT